MFGVEMRWIEGADPETGHGSQTAGNKALNQAKKQWAVQPGGTGAVLCTFQKLPSPSPLSLAQP